MDNFLTLEFKRIRIFLLVHYSSKIIRYTKHGLVSWTNLHTILFTILTNFWFLGRNRIEHQIIVVTNQTSRAAWGLMYVWRIPFFECAVAWLLGSTCFYSLFHFISQYFIKLFFNYNIYFHFVSTLF